MADIKTIVFDYGGVISCIPGDENIKEMASITGISPDDFVFHYMKNRGEYDRGVWTGFHYWKNLNPGLSEKDIQRLIRLDAESWLVINSETTGLIRDLSKQYSLAILSNMTYDAMEYLLASDWIKYFSHRLFSCELKDIKPNLSVYRTLADKTGNEPGEMIFIDDTRVNVLAARESGIHGILYDRNTDLKTEIHRIVSD